MFLQTQDLLESSNSLAQTWSSSGQEVNVSRPSTSSGTEAIRPHLRRPSSFVEVEHVETMQKQVRTALADLDEIKSAKLPSRPQINTLFSLAFAPNADERNVRPKTADLMHSGACMHIYICLCVHFNYYLCCFVYLLFFLFVVLLFL